MEADIVRVTTGGKYNKYICEVFVNSVMEIGVVRVMMRRKIQRY